MLVADKNHNRILSFPADGATTVWPSVVAGTGAGCASATSPCGDGGAATSAQLQGPGAVAVGIDGVIYVADSHEQRIRRILPNGTITAFAGNGKVCTTGPCGDGGPAVNASLGNAATGEGPFGVAVAPDGVVYIADTDVGRVRRVLTDGTIENVLAITHPKALFVRSTATGDDVLVPEWESNEVSLLSGVDTDPARTVGVSRNGTGSGGVTGPFVDCPSDCSATYPDRATRTLTATPAADSDFAGWSAPECPGTGACTLSMTADRTITATFTLKPAPPVTPPATDPVAPPTTDPVPAPAPPPLALAVSGSLSGPKRVKLGKKLTLRYRLSAPAVLTLEIRPPKGRTQHLRLGRRNAGTGTVSWNEKLHGRMLAGRYGLRLIASASGVTRRTPSYSVLLHR